MTTSERIARITDADLGPEGHGIFTTHITLDYGDSSAQGVPQHFLDDYDPEAKVRIGTAYGMEWILRIMRAAGVDRWSKVKGRTVLALIEDGQVVGLAPLPTEHGSRFVFADLRAETGQRS